MLSYIIVLVCAVVITATIAYEMGHMDGERWTYTKMTDPEVDQEILESYLKNGGYRGRS